MTDTFHKGEIAYYVRPGSPYYGREVEILSDLRWYRGGGYDHVTGLEVTDGYRYEVDLPKILSRRVVAEPQWLKKKKPPAYESGQHGAGWEWYHEIPKASEVEA